VTSTGDAGPELPPGAALGVTPHGTPSMQSLADLEIQIEQARCRAVVSGNWMGVTVYGPEELTAGFLEHARTAGFTDSDWCEMRHEPTGGRLDFAPVPAGYPDTIRNPRQWLADLRALAEDRDLHGDGEVRKAAARVLAVLSPPPIVVGDDFLRTLALREAGCICTPGRLAGGPKAHAEDLRCPVHKEVSGGPV
jgi:hypothetical protein